MSDNANKRPNVSDVSGHHPRTMLVAAKVWTASLIVGDAPIQSSQADTAQTKKIATVSEYGEPKYTKPNNVAAATPNPPPLGTDSE